MNIFFFDIDPVKSAEYLCDKHVVKMTTETLQILSTTYYLRTGNRGIYKPTHIHYPCVIWAASSYENFDWLCKYMIAISNEYTKRYKRQHLARTKFSNWLYSSAIINNLNFPTQNWTNPPQCMPEQYKQSDTVKAYKAYYIGEKLKFSTWKYNTKPDWI